MARHSFFELAFKPCHGKLPRLKYMSTSANPKITARAPADQRSTRCGTPQNAPKNESGNPITERNAWNPISQQVVANRGNIQNSFWFLGKEASLQASSPAPRTSPPPSSAPDRRRVPRGRARPSGQRRFQVWSAGRGPGGWPNGERQI